MDLIRRLGDHSLYSCHVSHAREKNGRGETAYDGQHITKVLELDWTDVAAVVKASGHVIGRILKEVKPSPP